MLKIVNGNETILRIDKLKKLGVKLKPQFVRERLSNWDLDYIRSQKRRARAIDACLNAHKLRYKIRKFFRNLFSDPVVLIVYKLKAEIKKNVTNRT